LGHDGPPAAEAPSGQARNEFSGKEDFAIGRPQLAGEKLEQRRFARATGADHDGEKSVATLSARQGGGGRISDTRERSIMAFSLRQNELIVRGDPQAVTLACVNNRHVTPLAQKVARVDFNGRLILV
jgi:hypothetical protein